MLFGDDTLCEPVSATFETLTCQVVAFNMTKINEGREVDELGLAEIWTTVTVYVNGISDVTLDI